LCKSTCDTDGVKCGIVIPSNKRATLRDTIMNRNGYSFRN